ncbi:MAG: DUF2318 domain-containing protein [Deltaproteobacteria bacterium]|nr:MAG: DUF2318 domain-containing protein [Deltaproteobacteria bacterium]
MSNDKLDAKRKAVTEKSGPNFTLIAIIGGLIVIGAFVFLKGTGDEKAKAVEAKPVHAATAAASNETAKADEVVRLKVSDFDDGKAHFYNYTTKDGLAIRYFAVKSTDGVIRAAFDACDSCWRSGKGYRQDGDTMICNNCGLVFPTDKINEVKGGCNPAPLKRTIEGEELVISISDIIGGSPYFDLPRK